ncbi:hypothetical protein FRB95_005820 [Tulasnella sp. JGI-2019a]|nr:hypothetical protein FRB95_005820 [Tulasnella sp. JGI-2019a]
MKIPRALQKIMTTEELPVLSGTLPVLERFVARWEKMQGIYPELREPLEEGLKKELNPCVLVLNPSQKLAWINKSWDVDARDAAARVVKRELRKYSTKSQHLVILNLAAAKTVLTGHWNALASDDEDDGAVETAGMSVDDEFTAYTTAKLSATGCDILQFWDIAMDHLPIQASAVPCERVFSSGKETMTAWRNRIKPELKEALQMLKFALRKKRLNFTGGCEIVAKGVEETVDAHLLARITEAVKLDGALDEAYNTLVLDDVEM